MDGLSGPGRCNAGRRSLYAFKGEQTRSGLIALFPDGRALASASDWDVVRLWEVGSGLERGTVARWQGDVGALAFSRTAGGWRMRMTFKGKTLVMEEGVTSRASRGACQ